MKKIAVVTGSNQGIGFAIVRALCKSYDGEVYLTSRDMTKGLTSLGKLTKEGLRPKFHLLDIDDKESITNFKEFIQETHGGLDLLVNNAGIAYKNDSTAPFLEQAEVTIRVNYTGTLNFCNALFPLLRPGARVVNVSSLASMVIGKISTDNYYSRLLADDLTIPELSNIMQQFINDVRAGNHEKKGWPNTAYGMSKVGVTALSRIQQKEFDTDPRKDIIVNACCPGYVATNMSSFKGNKTIDEGAETPVYLALLPPGIKEPKGKFVSEKVVVEWK